MQPGNFEINGLSGRGQEHLYASMRSYCTDLMCFASVFIDENEEEKIEIQDPYSNL